MTDVFYYGNAGGAPSANNQNQNGLDSSYSPLVAFPPPSRQRRSRTMFTDDDVRMLEDFFTRDPYPDIYGREELAAAIGVPEARIQTWFQNKRSRTRRRLNNTSQRSSPPTTSSPPNNQSNSNTNNMGSSIKQESVFSPLQSPIPCLPSRSPVFQLQAPPSVHGTRTGTLTPEYRQRTSPKLRIITPSKGTPSKVTPSKGTPVKVSPSKVTPVTERDADDSGVLDLSIKSNDSPKDMSTLRGSLSARQAAPDSPSRMDAASGRPFFTPWAPSSTYTAAGSFLPPAVVTSAAKMAAGDAVTMAAATAGTQMSPSAAFPMPAQFSAQNPWLYGFTPSYNPQNGAYYLQPLPASPFLHHVADVFPASPVLTPLTGTPSGNWAANYLSPSLRSAPKHFLFPDVAATNLAASPTRCGKLCNSPPTTPMSAATTITDQGALTPAHLDLEALTPAHHLDMSAPTKTEQGLSESPGSDAGSRSSGYSSRDSDIDVCN